MKVSDAKSAVLALLLLFKSPGKHKKVAALRECCKHRMAILLQNGHDPQQCHGTFFRLWSYQKPISAVEFAKDCGVLDVLEDALTLAGWSSSHIHDIFEEDDYLGLVDLMDGISYMSQAQCREQFIWNLCAGKFLTICADDMEVEACEISASLGIWWDDVVNMIQASNAAFRLRSIPGGWNEEEDSLLIPGLDFPLPQYCGEDIPEWVCVCNNVLGSNGAKAKPAVQV